MKEKKRKKSTNWTGKVEELVISLSSNDPDALSLARKTLFSMAEEADFMEQAVRKDRTAHPVGSRVEVLDGFHWVPGTVHKRIYDDKLKYHDHGPVISTVTWVVWLDDQRWWRGDMSEHIRGV